MEISIRTNFPQVAKAVESMAADLRDKTMASALNKTLEQGRTQMVRELAAEYKVRASDVRNELAIARARPVPGKLEAALMAKGKRSANLIRFVERSVSLGQQRKRMSKGDRDIRFEIKKGGGKKTLKGAFIANKGRTVFRRIEGSTMQSRSKYAGTKHAEAIAAVSTIYVPQMFNQRKLNARVVAVIEAKFATIFNREARYRIAAART